MTREVILMKVLLINKVSEELLTRIAYIFPQMNHQSQVNPMHHNIQNHGEGLYHEETYHHQNQMKSASD